MSNAKDSEQTATGLCGPDCLPPEWFCDELGACTKCSTLCSKKKSHTLSQCQAVCPGFFFNLAVVSTVPAAQVLSEKGTHLVVSWSINIHGLVILAVLVGVSFVLATTAIVLTVLLNCKRQTLTEERKERGHSTDKRNYKKVQKDEESVLLFTKMAANSPSNVAHGNDNSPENISNKATLLSKTIHSSKKALPSRRGCSAAVNVTGSAYSKSPSYRLNERDLEEDGGGDVPDTSRTVGKTNKDIQDTERRYPDMNRLTERSITCYTGSTGDARDLMVASSSTSDAFEAKLRSNCRSRAAVDVHLENNTPSFGSVQTGQSRGQSKKSRGQSSARSSLSTFDRLREAYEEIRRLPSVGVSFFTGRLIRVFLDIGEEPYEVNTKAAKLKLRDNDIEVRRLAGECTLAFAGDTHPAFAVAPDSQTPGVAGRIAYYDEQEKRWMTCSIGGFIETHSSLKDSRGEKPDVYIITAGHAKYALDGKFYDDPLGPVIGELEACLFSYDETHVGIPLWKDIALIKVDKESALYDTSHSKVYVEDQNYPTREIMLELMSRADMEVKYQNDDDITHNVRHKKAGREAEKNKSFRQGQQLTQRNITLCKHSVRGHICGELYEGDIKINGVKYSCHFFKAYNPYADSVVLPGDSGSCVTSYVSEHSENQSLNIVAIVSARYTIPSTDVTFLGEVTEDVALVTLTSSEIIEELRIKLKGPETFRMHTVPFVSGEFGNVASGGVAGTIDNTTVYPESDDTKSLRSERTTIDSGIGHSMMSACTTASRPNKSAAESFQPIYSVSSEEQKDIEKCGVTGLEGVRPKVHAGTKATGNRKTQEQ